MSHLALKLSASNPFATRCVRPGAIPFMFLPSQPSESRRSGRVPTCSMSIESMAKSLGKNNDWGQIIGPHGSGKSTLLETLLPILKTRGTEPVTFSLHDGQRRLTGEMRAVVDAAPPRSIVVVDGYEQLGRWSRYCLKKACRRRGLGLLVTAHQTVGLPTLVQMSPDVNLLQAVVDHLVADCPGVISSDDVRRSWQAHGENIREMLFSLFDVFEARRSARAEAAKKTPA